MALVLEDGTGVANANAYVSLAEALAHHTDCGNTKWTDGSIDPARTSAIIRATFYVDKRFGERFRGWRERATQGLQWPRVSAYDKDGFLLANMVPVPLKRAVCEYALRALLYNVLAPDPTPSVPSQSMVTGVTSGESRAGGEIVREKIVVGPVEIEEEYAPSSTSSSSVSSTKSGLVDGWKIPEYPEADLWIEELLHGQRHQLLRC